MKNKGITLIALVITIIVLLILAGVSISMLSGDNGLLTRAKEAKGTTETSGAKEAIQMEVAGSFTNEGIYNKDLAKANIEQKLNNPKALVTDNGNGTLNVTYKGYNFFVGKRVKFQDYHYNCHQQLIQHHSCQQIHGIKKHNMDF